MVRQRFLVSPFGGSNPSAPAILPIKTMLNSHNKLPSRNLSKSQKTLNVFENEFFETNQTYIHPSAIIGGNVKLEANVKVGPFCSIIGNVTIKSGTRIYPNVSIGFPAQNLTTRKCFGSIEIGKNCEIREFSTISSPKTSNGKTIIGDNCYIMNFCHIAHDVILENNVTLINNVNLAGHVYIEKYATLMANSASHQFCRIGKYAALTPFSGIRQDIPPFCLMSGGPAKFYGINKVALKRANFSSNDLYAIQKVTKLFYKDKLLLDDIKKVIAKSKETSNVNENSWTKNIHVQEFINFIENSSRGVSKRTALD